MKPILCILFLTLSLNCFSQSQTEMNREAHTAYKKSDEILNEIYKSILSRYKQDAVFIQHLKKSQRLWIKFRDAEMEVKFPNYPDQTYGSIHPTCTAYYLKDLTDQRISTLKNWLGGAEESEACNGSIQPIEVIEDEYMSKAIIQKNGSIWLAADMKKDHRIFGYEHMDILY